jgi:Tol biopolymer transport system component
VVDPRRIALAAALIFAALLAACGSGVSSGGGTPSQGGGDSGPGALILTRTNGIAEFDLGSKTETIIIPQPSPDTFLLDPAASDDGKNIAYILQPPPKVEGTTYDAGSDLWVAARDGSGAHAVFTHTAPNQLVRYPQWLDASTLLAVVQEATQAQGTTTVKYVLERIDAATGARTQLIENVLAYGLSPDHTHVAYSELSPSGGEALKTAALDGSDTVTVVGPEQDLLPFNSPRYSPDGSSIAFASADQTGAVADQRLVSVAPLAANPGPSADGLPEDIWTVAATGGNARRVANIKEDLPTLTWNGDGKHIYILGTQGLSDLTLASGALTRIGEGSFHGEIDWTPAPG